MEVSEVHMRDEACPWQHGVVLVCVNERDPGAAKPSCGRARGKRLKGWLKSAARAEDGPVSRCRVLETSCLDVCPPEGTAVGLMPGNEIVVVDAKEEREALLGRVKEHMEGAARNQGVAKRVLGRLRRG